MSVHDVDRPVDLDALAQMFAGPGPYPWTAARDVRLALAELIALRAEVEMVKGTCATETRRPGAR